MSASSIPRGWCARSTQAREASRPSSAFLQVGPVTVDEAVRRSVVDAREIEAVVAADANVLVAQHAHAELRAEVRDPRVGARVVLVVARDEEDAVLGTQLRERARRARASVVDGAVDEIARDGDEIGRSAR